MIPIFFSLPSFPPFQSSPICATHSIIQFGSFLPLQFVRWVGGGLNQCGVTYSPTHLVRDFHLEDTMFAWAAATANLIGMACGQQGVIPTKCGLGTDGSPYKCILPPQEVRLQGEGKRLSENPFCTWSNSKSIYTIQQIEDILRYSIGRASRCSNAAFSTKTSFWSTNFIHWPNIWLSNQVFAFLWFTK